MADPASRRYAMRPEDIDLSGASSARAGRASLGAAPHPPASVSDHVPAIGRAGFRVVRFQGRSGAPESVRGAALLFG